MLLTQQQAVRVCSWCGIRVRVLIGQGRTVPQPNSLTYATQHWSQVLELMKVQVSLTCQAATDVLPPQCITLQISINLTVPQMLQAPLPRQEKVLHQEVTGNNADAVVTPTHAPQLTHAWVIQRARQREETEMR